MPSQATRTPPKPTTQVCHTCKRRLRPSAFYKSRKKDRAITKTCKECCRKRDEPLKDKAFSRNHRLDENGQAEKLCPDCKLWKSAVHFKKHWTAKDGLSVRCKTCVKRPRPF